MRSLADMDILVLDISNQCFLRCSNCTRAVAHQTHKREMTPDQLRAALRSLKGWWQPGRVVGLIGGEPTLHSQFSEMCKVFREEWNPGMDPQHGREPIADFNQFAEQRLWDRSNGRGLWTSFGPRFVDHYEVVMDTFSHWNPNDHTAGGVHQTNLVDAKEMCNALGIPWEDFPKYRDNCWVQNTWSGSITPKGGYFCEHAGTLDLLYNEGKNAWPIEDGWWRRVPSDFGDQIHLCEMCSLCLPGPGQVDSRERDIIGKSHRIRLAQIGSPAVRGGRFDEFNPDVHLERRQVETKDSYTAGPRVSAGNRSMMPKKLSAVVVCVGRAEHLRQTIEHNAKQVDEMIVVCHPDDTATGSVIRSVPGVKWVDSDRCFDGGSAFNKGKLLNDGLRALGPGADWVVLTDADIFLPDNLREFVFSHALNPGVLYGASRDNGSPGIPQVNGQPNGYFQLFNRRALAIRDTWPAVMSEEFCSAGGVDSWFLIRWPSDKRVMIPELTCRHIPHGEGIGAGWNGDSNEKRWRQIGLITAANGAVPTVDAVRVNGTEPIRVRLVDTLRGDVWEGELRNGQDFPREIVTVTKGPLGVVFKERVLWDGHLHVSAWC